MVLPSFSFTHPTLLEYDELNVMIVILSFFCRVLSILVELGRLLVLSNNHHTCGCVQIEVGSCIS